MFCVLTQILIYTSCRAPRPQVRTLKKIVLITVAVSYCIASGFAQAQNEITSELDASLRLGLGLSTEPDAELTFEDYNSRIRWSGSADTGEGLKAISYLEFGFNQDDGINDTRYGWIGVEGDFGSLMGGKQYNAFYDAVTVDIDIADWGSCYHEISCARQSSVIKYAGHNDADIQFMASTVLIEGDVDNDFIDGFDVGARLKSGDMTVGAGATLIIGNTVAGVDLGTGVGLGVSASAPVGEATVSASLQFANEDYYGGEDNTLIVAGAFEQDRLYGVLSIRDSDNTPFYATLGYRRPFVGDKVFTYFEVGVVDPDVVGVDADVQARAVMVFNMDLLGTGNY